MIELPETHVLVEQINQTLVGKTIRNVVVNANPHSFAFYTGDPNTYRKKLASKKITSSLKPGTGYTCGGVEILCEDMLLVISTPIKYHASGEKLPKSHQLLIEFDDFSHMSCTVQMWGGMCCYPIMKNGLPKDRVCDRCSVCHKGKCPNPLTDAFDQFYFDNLWCNAKPTLSAKAFLATEQRIPGLGNGVLQDILFNAQIHPKRKLQTINDKEKKKVFRSIKSTLKEMKENGGRDTEKDLFNCNGKYKTILSNNTLKTPCRVCGGKLIREAYLGGNIYYCSTCQK
jgi:formamidopyrimidine-DNA glycosylase